MPPYDPVKARASAIAAGQRAAGTSSGLKVPAFDPSKFAAAPTSGVHKLTPREIAIMQANQAAERAAGLTGPQPLTGGDIATMRGNQLAQLGAGLAGPFTPEAVASGYASTIAGLYGTNYPAAQSWAAMAARNRWDQTTFEGWLRARPEFARTSVGQKMRADAVLVLAQVFGVV